MSIREVLVVSKRKESLRVFLLVTALKHDRADLRRTKAALRVAVKALRGMGLKVYIRGAWLWTPNEAAQNALTRIASIRRGRRGERGSR